MLSLLIVAFSIVGKSHIRHVVMHVMCLQYKNYFLIGLLTHASLILTICSDA